MDIALDEFKNNFDNNINKIKEEYNLLKTQIKKLEEQNTNLEQENIKLKNSIDELNREKKAKASSTLWESLNSKVVEKDNIIEQLKKEIEFYNRTCIKNNINICDKYQSKLKSNSSDLTLTEINKIKQNDLITIDKKDNKIEVNLIKNIDTINYKNEINEINENINEKMLNEKMLNEKNIIILDNHVTNLKKKDKSKDKLKDKSEKNKKKNKKIIEDDNDLDDLEKELAGIK
jgi:hypothetical protein